MLSPTRQVHVQWRGSHRTRAAERLPEDGAFAADSRPRRGHQPLTPQKQSQPLTQRFHESSNAVGVARQRDEILPS